MGVRLTDILAPQLPMEKTHERLGIENPFLKMMTDPFMLAGLATGGLSGASAARKAMKNRGVRKQLAAGFMPKEAAEKTALKGRLFDVGETIENTSADNLTAMGGNPVERTGKPMLMYHGTQTPFGRLTQESVDAVPENLYGPGYYQTSSPDIASDYATQKPQRGPGRGPEPAPNVRMSYVDTRKPFDAESNYRPEDIPPLRKFLEDATEQDAAFERDFLNEKFAKEQEVADLLSRTRRVASKKSDREVLEDVFNVMDVDAGARRGPDIAAEKGSDWWAIHDALDQADLESMDAGPGGYIGAADELDDLMWQLGGADPGMSLDDHLARPEVQKLLPRLRKTIRDLGEEQYNTPTPDDWLQLSEGVRNLSGDRVFQSLRRGAAEAPVHPELAKLLQGYRMSGYGNSPEGMDLEAAREALKRSGYDSLIHHGGAAMGGPSHLVNIAWDPNQVYLPYIADEMQRYRPEAAGGTLAGLLSATGAARQSRRRR